MSAGHDDGRGEGREDEHEAIGRLLASLPAIEPPRATLDATRARVEARRAKRRWGWAGSLGVVAAGGLATIGITWLGRTLDAQRAPAGTSTSTVDQTVVAEVASGGGGGSGGRVDLGPHLADGRAPAGVDLPERERGRFTLGDDDDLEKRGRASNERDREETVAAASGLVDYWSANATEAVDGVEEQAGAGDGSGAQRRSGADQVAGLDGDAGVTGEYRLDRGAHRVELKSEGYLGGVVAYQDTTGAELGTFELRLPQGLDDGKGETGGSGDTAQELDKDRAFLFRQGDVTSEGEEAGALASARDHAGDDDATRGEHDGKDGHGAKLGWDDEDDRDGADVHARERAQGETRTGKLSDADKGDESRADLATVLADTEEGRESTRRGGDALDGVDPVGKKRPPGRDDEKVAFIAARGWFLNTYVPGDAPLARLRAELGRGLFRDGAPVRLENLAATPPRGLPGPSDRALALQVSADASAVDGPRRVTVQVALSGAERAATQRSPVALALVVDLGTIASEDERRALWSVADRLAAARASGDHLFVVVPRGGEPLVIAGDEVTPAEVTRVLAARYEARGAAPLGAEELRAAVARAYAEVGGAAVGDEVIASREVVLASAVAPNDAALAAMVRQRARAGVAASFIGTTRADGRGAEALALAGSGRSWVTRGPDDAARVVEGELGAAGAAVARALRLQLKLAPGVQLVEVIGSRPLAPDEIVQTRAVERAIEDAQVRASGIAVDTARDEDGIQIAIPTFLGGDRHAVLLDVWVPGPGPVLEARVRYKDLVRMDNGASQAALELPRGAGPETALTREVDENRRALDTARALGAAAARLEAGDVSGALAVVHARAGRLGAGAADGPLLGAYRDVLAALRPDERAVVRHVALSLRLAAAIRSGVGASAPARAPARE